VYVAGTPGDPWAYSDGEVYRDTDDRDTQSSSGRRRSTADASQSLSAPMPATVLQILVSPGDQVRKAQTLLVLEAMKMELPVRSAADATVKAVHCRPGELVQPGTTLIEME
jgi:biotin carboxyl carrier protein